MTHEQANDNIERHRSVIPRRASLFTRQTVFWKVAGLLVGVQVIIALVAVGLSGWFAFDQSVQLAANSVRVRLDEVAEEIEQRGAPLYNVSADLPGPLRQDLRTRFPDPVLLLNAEGVPVDTLRPDSSAFEGPVARGIRGALPSGLDSLLAEGSVIVQTRERGRPGAWGLAPLYAPDGLMIGGVLVQPLRHTIGRELAGTRSAYIRALGIVIGLSLLTAILLGALFTWRLVRPLQRVTRQVERIEAGDYAARLRATGNDEFGRLGAAVNRMAEAVQSSIESLRATDELRRELIANVGHDVRTPLAALVGYLEEAERHLERDRADAAADALHTAARQGDYIRRLIDDLFELSMLDRPRVELTREPVPLAELILDVATTHRPAFREKGVDLNLDVQTPLPVVQADGMRLVRALGNLIGNALRHTPAGGTVRIRASSDENEAVVEVVDSGVGMDEETLRRAFERYYRGQDARTRSEDGTGLGLAISQAVAQVHGGTLQAYSKPGEGSTFTLRLPARGVADER